MAFPIGKGAFGVRSGLFAAGQGKTATPSVIRALVLIAFDLLALAAAAIGGLFAEAVILYLRSGHATPLATLPEQFATIAMTATLICIFATLALNRRYAGRMPFWSELRLVFQTCLFGAVMMATIGLALRDFADCAPMVATLLLLPALATVANRIARRALARADISPIDVLLIGEPAEMEAMAAAFRSDPLLGYRVACRADPSALMPGSAALPMAALMRQHDAQQVIVTLDPAHLLFRPLVDAAKRESCACACVPVGAIVHGEAQVGTSFLSNDTLLMRLHQAQARPAGTFLKICFDVSFTILLLAALSPLIATICVVNACSGGPIFYAHRRIGLGGKSFQCLKFRTMRVDGDDILARHLAADPEAAEEWEASRKLRHDPRITPLGHILRKTSLDELPQLINVLRLDMSLVGPRPIVQGEVAFYGEHFAHYTAMRPGLTGLWQVSGRSNTSYERRVLLDSWYVRNWSFWSDFAVLLKTIPAVLRREGAQ